MFGRKLVREQDVKDSEQLVSQLTCDLIDARRATLDLSIVVGNLNEENAKLKAELDAAAKDVTDLCTAQPEAEKQKPMLVENGIPRRSRLDLLTPLENKVRAAFIAIEHSSAHPLLTAAGMKVQEALELIADYVEKGEKQ